MRQFPKHKKLTRCAPGTCAATLPPRLISRPPFALCAFALDSEIVKIGEFTDFRPIRPRCTKDLRKTKSAYADFLQKPFPEKTGLFRNPVSLCSPDRSLTV